MNDLEINKAVAEKLGYTEVSPSLYEDPCVRAIAEDESMIRHFDYCNNWQDAGPIIEKYKIDLTHEDGNCYASVSGENELVITDDKSALKAAMLCFLEMEINDDK